MRYSWQKTEPQSYQAFRSATNLQEIQGQGNILFIYLNLFICLHFFFWLRWVFVAVHGLSLVAASVGYSSLRCTGFSLWRLLLLWSMGSRRTGFSSCGVQAQELWHMGLVAPRHVGSSRTRAQTHVPCIGRYILNHCATREVQRNILNDREAVRNNWLSFFNKYTSKKGKRQMEWEMYGLK